MSRRTSLPVWFLLSLALVSAACAHASWTLLRVMRSLQFAEAPGLLSVGRGIAEANQIVLLALYLAVAVSIISIVVHTRRPKTNNAMVTLAASVVALVPVAIVWLAESLMLEASSRQGLVPNASLVLWILYVGIGSGVVLSILLLATSALRVSATGTKMRVIAALLLLVVAFTVAAVAFQLRNAWIERLYSNL